MIPGGRINRRLAVLLFAMLVLPAGCNLNSESVAVGAADQTPADKASLVTAAAKGSKGIAARIGYTAPDFALPDTHDQVRRLSDYRGRVVLLNFWATWCGPCRIEMPTLQALSEDYEADRFQVLAVAGDVDGKSRVAPFMERLRLTFPSLLDPDGRIQDLYYVNAMPMTYILDQDGVVVYKFVGYFDWNTPKYRRLLTDLMGRT